MRLGALIQQLLCDARPPAARPQSLTPRQVQLLAAGAGAGPGGYDARWSPCGGSHDVVCNSGGNGTVREVEPPYLYNSRDMSRQERERADWCAGRGSSRLGSGRAAGSGVAQGCRQAAAAGPGRCDACQAQAKLARLRQCGGARAALLLQPPCAPLPAHLLQLC